MDTLIRSLLLTVALVVLVGCAITPDPSQNPPWQRDNLVFEERGFVESRTGWYFPQVLADKWMAHQAWEYQETVVGFEYRQAKSLPDIATIPTANPLDAPETGTVSILVYPVDHSIPAGREEQFPGGTAGLTGIGHLQATGIEEFWAYQKELQARGFNLWKLVKLQVPAAPDRTFHSQLVLKNISDEFSDGIVLTVGQASDCYVLILIRRLVRNKEDVDLLGDWAYSVLQELNLEAVRN